jgi:hypothetical protein
MGNATLFSAILIAVVLISGCIDAFYLPEAAGMTTINTTELIADPAEHYGEEHTFIAVPAAYDNGEFFRYYITDGNRSLPLNYTDFGCVDCLITGTVGKLALCDCWGASCSGEDCEPHDDEWEFLDTRPADDCENRTTSIILGNLMVKNFLRCRPGTESDVYYFQVQDAVPVGE